MSYHLLPAQLPIRSYRVCLFQVIGRERGFVRNNHNNHEKGKRKDLPRKIYLTKLWATKTVATTKAIIVKV